MSWQDPSADLANVNAAYRIERDENRRLRAALNAIASPSGKTIEMTERIAREALALERKGR